MRVGCLEDGIVRSAMVLGRRDSVESIRSLLVSAKDCVIGGVEMACRGP